MEAEAPDGDLSHVTQAVQNALRSPDGSTPTRRAITAVAQRMPPSNDAQDTAEAVDVEDVEMEAAEKAAPSAQRTPRKPKSPEVVDVDLLSEPSFESYAQQKNTNSLAWKALVVAAWFKLHRGVDAIGADHLYTCFKKAKWSTNIPDFGGPLRNLKFDRLMEKSGKGLYTINHLGLSQVEEK